MARPDSPGLIYLDSCILLAYLKVELHPMVNPLMKLLLDGKYEAVVSSLHYVEVIGKRRDESFDQQVESAAMSLIEESGFRMIDLGPDVQLTARSHVLHEGLKPCDAMHVAAAVVGGCDVLMTSDQGLQKRFGNKREIDGVWIDEVYLPSNETGAIEGLQHPLAPRAVCGTS